MFSEWAQEKDEVEFLHLTAGNLTFLVLILLSEGWGWYHLPHKS